MSAGRITLVLLAVGAAVIAIIALLVLAPGIVSESDRNSAPRHEADGSPAAGASEADVADHSRLLPPETRPALRAFVDPQADERLPEDFDYQVDQVSDPREVDAVVAVLRDLGPVSSPEAFNLIEDLSRPVPERDPIGETAALTDPTEEEMLEDLRKRLKGDTRP